jgi:hypothetical protein
LLGCNNWTNMLQVVLMSTVMYTTTAVIKNQGRWFYYLSLCTTVSSFWDHVYWQHSHLKDLILFLHAQWRRLRRNEWKVLASKARFEYYVFKHPGGKWEASQCVGLSYGCAVHSLASLIQVGIGEYSTEIRRVNLILIHRSCRVVGASIYHVVNSSSQWISVSTLKIYWFTNKA